MTTCCAVVGDELGGHRLELPGEDQVEHQGHDGVVAVVAEGDLGAAELDGEAVEDAAAQAGAEGAVGLALGDLVGDDRVGVLADHAEIVAPCRHVLLEEVAGVAGVALIDVDAAITVKRTGARLRGR
jgi:hypothetical protein